MRLFDIILGRYLADSESEAQRIGVSSGIPLLGLDGLTSSAYGTEAAMTVLISVGMVGINYVIPITSIVIGLLFILFLSYRQTIDAYPSGGGSYTVAKENLGEFPGLLAAAALMLDYLLTVAVGIAAGVGALISALPILQTHILSLSLIILFIITLVNLRGVKESGSAFLIPTYLFIVSLVSVLSFGIIKSVLAHGAPLPVEAMKPPVEFSFQAPVTLWILLRAFASGCAAMTGVEAVSNGVTSFKEPVAKNAKLTLTAIIFILIFMLGSIGYLSVAYKISAADPTLPGYESVVSQLIRAIVGRGFFYYLTIGSIVTVLGLSANTAFAGFPRLCQIVSKDDFLPHIFTERGRRLVYTFGIVTLSVLAAVLLIIFGGLTDRLIPLYAIGAFLAFTLSQFGMVIHWKRLGVRNHTGKIVVNAVGGVATAVTLLVVLVSKFSEGGWISAAVIIMLLFYFYWIRTHYRQVAAQIACTQPLSLAHTQEPIVIVPFRDWSKLSRKALGYAMQLSTEVYAAHAFNAEYPDEQLDQDWQKYVVDPVKGSDQKLPKLVKLKNPYRKLFGSLITFIDEIEQKNPERRIAIVIPQLVVHRWYQFLLHNQRAVLLSAALLMRKDSNIIFVTVPWYLDT